MGLTSQEVNRMAGGCRVCGGSGKMLDTSKPGQLVFILCSRCKGTGHKGVKAARGF